MNDFFSTEVEVTEADLSADYNHVHHAGVIEYLELGRLRLLESRGVPQSMYVARDLFLVVTRLQVQYRGEMTLGTYQVLCFNPEVKSRKVEISQVIATSEGLPLVEAQVEIMFMDGRTRRVVRPPADFVTAFKLH